VSDVTVERFSASEPGAWSNSYLVSDGGEALLFDVFQLRSDAQQLADSVEASGKQLTKVWISHAHPNHFLQLSVIVDRFPSAEVLSTPNVVDDLKEHNLEGWLTGTHEYLHAFATRGRVGRRRSRPRGAYSEFPDHRVQQFLDVFSLPAYLPLGG
jgi:glyoxylase-like metal-dependent hydrolase (beta-lactamase superfamily II)